MTGQRLEASILEPLDCSFWGIHKQYTSKTSAKATVKRLSVDFATSVGIRSVDDLSIKKLGKGQF